MPNPIVVVSDPIPETTLAELVPHCDVRVVDGRDRAALLAAVADATALIVRSGTQVDREVLTRAPALKIVARAGVGLDNVDVPYARAKGITVTNAPDSNAVSVAELTVGLVIASLRHICAAAQHVGAGEWQRSAFLGSEVAGRTLGILGLGRVGRQVARRLAAFDMRLIAHDPHVSAADAAGAGCELVSLDRLLKDSDVLTIHLPKTAETTGLLGETEFARVKPSLCLVNTARGGIVDEDALTAALKNSRIAFAALDVFAQEPPVASPLLQLPNVLATPHLGAGTDSAQRRAGRSAVRSVLSALGTPGV
ncbi:hydroxyacid dehydrogenase [Streptomyces aureoverticillatus]|uniref:hydroxyacid dehydrogenase n=1 Tax=Streptomyces aureoverticillatus TaxID=66871 RepID=UPI0013DA5226|nr:hydroxyacid dehydrogenase [Streptomyces aureoverticillatus]QIB42668.1 hypothetical protein G3H79_05895 [Streptomyces aureoverticillatus]